MSRMVAGSGWVGRSGYEQSISVESPEEMNKIKTRYRAEVPMKETDTDQGSYSGPESRSRFQNVDWTSRKSINWPPLVIPFKI